MTEMTDGELDTLIDEVAGLDSSNEAFRKFARAVLAKWSQPAHSGEPVYAFRRKGLDDFCTCTEKRYAELSAKPNLFETRIFYTAPQPVEREPLTEEQIKDEASYHGFIGSTEMLVKFVRGIEAAHGIKKGGQHGAE